MLGRLRRTAVAVAVVVVCALAFVGSRVVHRTGHDTGGTPDAYLSSASKRARHLEDIPGKVYRNIVGGLEQYERDRTLGPPYRTLARGDKDRKQIALTFDDGPHPAYTPQLLAILKRANVKATFFVVGELAAKHPDLIRAEIAAGHNVGNHTFHHVNLTKIPLDRVNTEIVTCGKVLQQITGKRPDLFRPPGGNFNRKVAAIATNLGYTSVLWTDDPADYADPGEHAITYRTLRDLDNGCIILLHDGSAETLHLLPRLLRSLKAMGWQFVTVEQMIASSSGRPAG